MPSSLDQDEDKTQEGRDLVEGLMMNVSLIKMSYSSLTILFFSWNSKTTCLLLYFT